MGFYLATLQTVLFIIALIANIFGAVEDVSVIKLGVFVILQHIWFWEELHENKD